MTFTTSLENARKDFEKTLSDPTPLYVLAGAGDFAVEKLRIVRDEFAAQAAKFDAKTLRDQAQANLNQAQASINERVESFQADVQAAPEQAKDLPAKLQAAFGEAVATVLSGAIAAYGDFAERGESLVTRVRTQQATEDLSERAAATTAKVKAATTTAKKSAKSTRTSAKATATTAKKSAARTKTATKSASTSAKKTATAAKKATKASASKVGR